ncbi:hypothetical protein PILCRDRAFT_510928 [Piloderma croceum F 1598]|uniref:Uncharacterized protein n=1 Tax=Piloderma croceum (strain F 1598) TaxID=765440 RepID=A0A0C3F8F9_PILCF|nr:hypothetical protein PILCRDRAFT_510928 [Piloderma croceum F 1598]
MVHADSYIDTQSNRRPNGPSQAERNQGDFIHGLNGLSCSTRCSPIRRSHQIGSCRAIVNADSTDNTLVSSQTHFERNTSSATYALHAISRCPSTPLPLSSEPSTSSSTSIKCFLLECTPQRQ